MKNLLGNIGVGGALVSALTGCELVKYIPQEVITVEPERYSWVVLHDQGGDIKGSYLKERIHHHEVSWERYQRLVKKKNIENSVPGRIELPDADNDGFVYFGGRIFALVYQERDTTEVLVDPLEEEK